jgi:hypothetical protein
VASISTSAFSDSMIRTIWPLSTCAPIAIGHSTTVPSAIVMPSFGILIGVGTSFVEIAQPSS